MSYDTAPDLAVIADDYAAQGFPPEQLADVLADYPGATYDLARLAAGMVAVGSVDTSLVPEPRTAPVAEVWTPHGALDRAQKGALPGFRVVDINEVPDLRD